MADESSDFLQDCNSVEEDPTLYTFLNWCKENGLILSEKVKVCSRGSCHRYGMVARENISQGESLFSIPRNLLLEPKTCLVANVLKDLTEENIGKSQRGSGWNPLLLALMYEYTNHMSFWRPYLDIVPGIDVLDQPMFWNQEDRVRLLKDTEIEEDVEQDLKCIEKEYSSVVKEFIKKNKKQFDNINHSLTLYKHMAAFVMAYSFTENSSGCQGDNAPVMVPMADILNHHSDNNAHLEFAKDELRMVSTQSILKGQEVFNTYGQLANCHLLQSYGFVEKTPNPNDTMDISVAIFYDVLQQLASTKHEARILDAKFQVMEEMGVASGDDVLVFDLRGCRNQGPDLSLFLKVLQLDEQELKEILVKDQESGNHPKDLEDLVCLFENCNEEQKSTSSKILENALANKDRKRANESLVDGDPNNVAIKKAKSRGDGSGDENVEVQGDDDESGYNNGSVDDEDGYGNDDDDDEYEDDEVEDSDDDDDDDDIDSDDSDSNSGNEDDKIDHVTYEQMKEFPLEWRETLCRVAEDCFSRIVTMEKEKRIDTENILELTARERSIKQMLGGSKDILRRVCELVNTRGDEHPS